MARKTEFWWASIHGADPEPVEKTEHEGRPCVYTLGCADPFYLDEPGVEFVAGDKGQWVLGGYTYPKPAPLQRPRLPDKAAAEAADEERRRRRYNAAHGWRGPR